MAEAAREHDCPADLVGLHLAGQPRREVGAPPGDNTEEVVGRVATAPPPAAAGEVPSQFRGLA